MFRYALRGAESEWASLDDELEFVRAYLEVERARFGDGCRSEVRVDDDVRGARVPTMMVQTLVENAVKHGLGELRGTAVVPSSATSRGRTGSSFGRSTTVPASATRALAAADGRPARAAGYGLANIRQRLDGYFGADAALTMDRDRCAG